MRWFKRIVIFTLISEFGFCAGSRAGTLEYSARPETFNNFAEASFSCILPPEKPRAILFLAGGTDSDARPWLGDSRWRTFAAKESLVLIAACLRGAGEPYEIAAQGSGQALLDAIAVFAKQGACPDLDHLPLILYGHSAGAQFAFNFACWKPELVQTIIAVKSGPLPKPDFKKPLPFRALFIVGERDQPGRVREVARAFATGRTQGAPWCLAFQPNAGHDTEGCGELAESFIKAARSETSLRAGYAELAAPNPAMKTVGATDPNQSWLPDAHFFQNWRSFVKGASLASLLTLPDERQAAKISWRPVTALPDHIDVSQPHGRFKYIVSAAEDSETITKANASASDPSIHVIFTRLTDRTWSLEGDCDLHNRELGPFKSKLEADLVTSTGVHERTQFTLFTRLTGPAKISPPSLYYGVVGRETTTVFRLEIRPDPELTIRSCDAISSDPTFAKVAVFPSEKRGEYVAQCTILSGSRVGPKNGHLTLRVQTDQRYDINVPFYGFVQK